MSYLIDVGTALPKSVVTQADFGDFYAGLFEDESVQRKIKFICNRSGILKRHTVQPDLRALINMSLEEKMALYFNEALPLAIEAIQNNPSFDAAQKDITDIISVSCTGMKAPGIEFDLIKHFGLENNIRRYNINFMGCYASIIALRLAHEICSQPNRTVLIISTELCTLHFQNKVTDDYLLSNALFSDGSGSVIVKSEPVEGSLKIDAFHSAIINDTKNQMGWDLSEHGFLMSLSKEVPKTIEQNISLPEEMYTPNEKVQWAVHPGGIQILHAFEQCFSLNPTDLDQSYQVLNQYGNMSSATILFIIKQLINNKQSKAPVIGCAFGPGLTLESIRLNHV